MAKLDPTDIEILRALQRNAKLTVKELADKVHLSPSPTFERQRRLEREGYIERYVAKVDPKKVGNTIVVFCNIKLKQHSGRLSEELSAIWRTIRILCSTNLGASTVSVACTAFLSSAK